MVGMTSAENAPQLDDETVLQLIASGHESDQRRALKAFYWRWASPMKHFFLARGCAAGVAEDLFQDAVIRIWKGAPGYKGQGQASAWIWAVARNTLTDHHRSARRSLSTLSLDPENPDHLGEASPPYDQAYDECIARAIERFAHQFPERAHALELWSAGIDSQAIAKQLGRSYGATRQFLLECRKKMRPFLEPCFDSSSSD